MKDNTMTIGYVKHLFDLHNGLNDNELNNVIDIEDICICEVGHVGPDYYMDFNVKADGKYEVNTYADENRISTCLFEYHEYKKAFDFFMDGVKHSCLEFIIMENDEEQKHWQKFLDNCDFIRNSVDNYKLVSDRQSYIYKVWDIDRGIYLSSGKKSIWKSIVCAENVIKEVCASRALGHMAKYGRMSNREANIAKYMEVYEVHTIELVVVDSYNAAVKLVDKKALEDQLESLERDVTSIEDVIVGIFNHNFSYNKLKDLLFGDYDYFNNELTANFKLEYAKITELKEKQNKIKKQIKDM